MTTQKKTFEFPTGPSKVAGFKLAAITATLVAVTLTGWSSSSYASGVNDPLEPVNRVTMRFNKALDTVLFKPAAKTYDKLVPRFAKNMIGNFFSNLGEVPTALNHTLQLRFDQAASDLGRFAVNSTLGGAGLFEVADPLLGIPKARQDFGQTLAHWGADAGPYLVLPILGPSTLRDGIGRGIDLLADPVTNLSHNPTSASMQAGRAVDYRSKILLFDNLVVGDEYLFVREAFLQLRAQELGQPDQMELAFEEF